MRKFTLLLIAIIIGLPFMAMADSRVNLTPVPKSMTVGNGTLVLPQSFTIATGELADSLVAEATKFANHFAGVTGYAVEVKGEAADALITLAALFFFGIETGLYCILGLMMKSALVDSVTDSFRTKKCFQIITDHPEPIVDFIVKTLHRGATLEDVHGAYTKSHKTMIVTVLSRSQALALRKYVHSVDPHAFMVITASTEIVGKGFLKS